METLRNSLNARLKFVLVIALGLIICLCFIWIWSHFVKQDIEPIVVDEVKAGPGGQIVLSYDRTLPDGQGTQLVPLVFDFSRDDLVYMEADKLLGTDSYSRIVFHHSFSNNARYASFTVATTPEANSETNAELGELPHQIYRADLSAVKNRSELVVALQGASPVTSNDNSVKHFPVVSDDGQILYASHPSTSSETAFFDSLLEDWEIHLVDQAGDDRVLLSGAHPKWLDENRFVYIKSDGIYLYDIKTETESFVEELPNSNIQTTIDVSNDGRMLAWSDITNNAVRLFEITNQEGTLELVFKTDSPQEIGSLVFSPDGKWLALQVPVLNGADEDLSTGILVYNTTTYEAYSTQPMVFSDANIVTTSFTDWVNLPE